MTSKYLKNVEKKEPVSAGIVTTIETITESAPVNEQTFAALKTKMIPAAVRLYPLYKKMDIKRFFSDEEFNKICLMVSGDPRRVIQRILAGIYQRAQDKRDAEEVKRARLLLSLHESGQLIQNLRAQDSLENQEE
jgi:hypothetical protein